MRRQERRHGYCIMVTQDTGTAEVLKFILTVFVDGRRFHAVLRKLQNGGGFASFRTYVARVGLMYAYDGKYGRYDIM